MDLIEEIIGLRQIQKRDEAIVRPKRGLYFVADGSVRTFVGLGRYKGTAFDITSRLQGENSATSLVGSRPYDIVVIEPTKRYEASIVLGYLSGALRRGIYSGRGRPFVAVVADENLVDKLNDNYRDINVSSASRVSDSVIDLGLI